MSEDNLTDDEYHGLLVLRGQSGMVPALHVLQALIDKGLVKGATLTPKGASALQRRRPS